MRQPNRCLENKNSMRSAAKGQGTIELVMSLLLFVMMLGTILSISTYLYINHIFLTAAKEGARAAAVESNLADAATYADGETNVQDRVVEFVAQSTGIELTPSDVDLTGPTGAVGDRTVEVSVTYQFQNPVQIRTFINRLGGGSASGLDTFNIGSTATMRYEE